MHPLVVPWTCSLPGSRRRKTTKMRTLKRRSGSRRTGDVSSVGTWVTYAGTAPNTATSNRGPSEHQVSPEQRDAKYDRISDILTDMHILKHTFRVLQTLVHCLDTLNRLIQVLCALIHPSSSHGTNHGELPVHPHSPDTCRLSWKNQAALWMCEYSS